MKFRRRFYISPKNKLFLFLLFGLFIYLFICLFVFIGLHIQEMEVPGLGVQLEL